MYPAPAIPLADDHSFDPAWLVDVLRRRFPENRALIDAAARCVRYFSGTELYVHFVSAENANRPGAEWQFAGSMYFADTPYGEIVVDVLKDGRIGGIEFLDRVFNAQEEGRLE